VDQPDATTWTVRGLGSAAQQQAAEQIRALGGDVVSVTGKRRSLEEIYLAQQSRSAERCD
jgi:hypothetical protein